MKKTRFLATVVILISFALAPSLVRADQDDYYQGRKGQWVQQSNSWRFKDRDGNVYRQSGTKWAWYNGRYHGLEGQEYHYRAAGDNRSYQQFQQQERH